MPNDIVINRKTFRAWMVHHKACLPALDAYDNLYRDFSPQEFYQCVHPAWQLWLVSRFYSLMGGVNKEFAHGCLRYASPVLHNPSFWHDIPTYLSISHWTADENSLDEARKEILERYPWHKVAGWIEEDMAKREWQQEEQWY